MAFKKKEPTVPIEMSKDEIVQYVRMLQSTEEYVLFEKVQAGKELAKKVGQLVKVYEKMVEVEQPVQPEPVKDKVKSKQEEDDESEDLMDEEDEDMLSIKL